MVMPISMQLHVDKGSFLFEGSTATIRTALDNSRSCAFFFLFKSVGCDKNLESGVVMDKCRICGGNSSECKPFRGRIQRLPAQFEKMSGEEENMKKFQMCI